MAWARIVCTALIFALSAYWTVGVVTNRFYYSERRPWSFGSGRTVRHIPVDTSEFLKVLPAEKRVFTSFNVSSTVLYFSRTGAGFREVPILTNTWAYPASTMSENFGICSGNLDFESFAKRYDVALVVLDCTQENAALARALLEDAEWTPAHFDGWNILFTRSHLGFPEGLSRFRDAARIAAEIEATEAIPPLSLHRVATALYTLGEYEPAEILWRECLNLDEEYYEVWNMLGAVLIVVDSRPTAFPGREPGDHDLIEAEYCFRRTLAIKPGYPLAERNLRLVKRLISEARKNRKTVSEGP